MELHILIENFFSSIWNFIKSNYTIYTTNKLLLSLNVCDDEQKQIITKKLQTCKTTLCLNQLLKSKDRLIRRGCCIFLGELKESKTVPTLLLALADEDYQVRSRAAYALGKIGDNRSVPELIKRLDDESDTVKDEAIRALGELCDTSAVEPLSFFLKNKSNYLRVVASEALKKIGNSAPTSELIKCLCSKDETVIESVTNTLVSIGDIIELERALKNEIAIIRQNSLLIITAIEKMKPGTTDLKRVTKILLEFVNESDNNNHAKREAAEDYIIISNCINSNKNKMNIEKPDIKRHEIPLYRFVFNVKM